MRWSSWPGHFWFLLFIEAIGDARSSSKEQNGIHSFEACAYVFAFRKPRHRMCLLSYSTLRHYWRRHRRHEEKNPEHCSRVIACFVAPKFVLVRTSYVLCEVHRLTTVLRWNCDDEFVVIAARSAQWPIAFDSARALAEWRGRENERTKTFELSPMTHLRLIDSIHCLISLLSHRRRSISIHSNDVDDCGNYLQ